MNACADIVIFQQNLIRMYIMKVYIERNTELDIFIYLTIICVS